MPISVNPETRVITIPQADLTPILGNLYELDVGVFWEQLKDFEDDEVGMAMPDSQEHNVPVELAGVTYARTIKIINGYSVTFEDTASPYTVRCVGANHNLSDVTNYVSEVSLIVGNAAGLIVTGGGASADDVWQHIGASAVNKEDDLIKARKAAETARNLSA